MDLKEFWANNKVNIIGWFVILVIIVAGIFVATSSQQQQQQVLNSELQVQEGDRTFGNKEAKVTIIEYADFQCPGCAYYSGILAEVKAQRSDKIQFIYRHYPLVNIHPNAIPAATAAEAAGRQGKFWEMHDLLFTNQANWAQLEDPRPTFELYANEISLDLEKYKADFEDPTVRANVDNGLESARKLGLDSTPTIFINGEETRAQTVEEFLQIIDRLAQ